MTLIGLLLPLLLIAAQPADPLVRRVPPLDECAGDAGFQAFRGALAGAIERRDARFLLDIVAEDIEVDFGGGAGRAFFAESWALDRPADSLLWDELAAVLRLGCARDREGGYWMPSMFVRDDYDDVFTAAVAIRPGASVHAEPDASSPVVATLDWDVVTVPHWDFEAPWQRIAMADGRAGHVRTDSIRSPIDYRALFVPEDGRWRLKVFIAGD